MEKLYEIDVHDYTVDYALKEVVKTAANLAKQKPCILSFVVIHGYHSGRAIKDALLSHKIKCRYIKKILPDPFNDGRTIICLN